MRIVADANIPDLQRTFGQHGEVQCVPGRKLTGADLAGADVLLVRSVTRVDRSLLQGSHVRFVGSATIGTDHLDIAWLEAAGIAWANAPGCNADAAAQYTLGMVLEACTRLGRRLREQRVGIIGRGNVGGRLAALLAAVEVPTVACDPPLAEAGEPGLVGLERALAEPVVSLHVPLTRSGPYPTWHLIGERELKRMPNGALLVNTARGDVVDGKAVLEAARAGTVHPALDVWPDEPRLDPGLLAASVVATPHVAGYSLEGRRNGTMMVYRAFCEWAGIRCTPPEFDEPVPRMTLDAGQDAALEAVRRACGVAGDDAAMRALGNLEDAHRADGFDRLRREYRPRRDFGAWRVCAAPDARALLERLGFVAA